jgi:hypothetical protein
MKKPELVQSARATGMTVLGGPGGRRTLGTEKFSLAVDVALADSR